MLRRGRSADDIPPAHGSVAPLVMLLMLLMLLILRAVVFLARARVGYGRAARSQSTLHEDAVGPAAELETYVPQHADPIEFIGLVQLDRGRVHRVYVGDHLAIARSSACLDQRRQQAASDAGVQMVLMDIDRILD